MPRKSSLIPSVKVVDIANKGKAIGRDTDGHVYLLDNCIPGDEVEFLYFKKRKGLRVGKISKVLSYSTDRVEARCSHFGVCGGCKWQNLKYEQQLFYKEKMVRDAITRIARDEGEKVKSIRASSKIYEYRNKLEYSFSSSRWLTEEEISQADTILDKQALGFHKAGMFQKVVNIDKCYLQHDLGNKIRNFIKDYSIKEAYSYYNFRSHSGFLRNLILRNTTEGAWMAILIFGEENKKKRERLLEALVAEFPEIASLYFTVNKKKNDSIFDQKMELFAGKEHIEQELCGIKYQISPKSFFQTNPYQTEILYGLVKDYAEVKPTDVVYDLYTGLGSIALIMASECATIIGIEEVPQAIQSAKNNALLNNISNAHFYCGDVKNVFNPDLFKLHGKADVLCINPPRAGVHKEVIQSIIDCNSQKLVYVSCNPATLARDITLLSENYELKECTPVDMFPHTHHVESVSLLTRK